jgi:hypothetical protein
VAGTEVAGAEVAAGGAVLELAGVEVGGLDEEPHPAASEMAASPASNGTILRGVMALYS